MDRRLTYLRAWYYIQGRLVIGPIPDWKTGHPVRGLETIQDGYCVRYTDLTWQKWAPSNNDESAIPPGTVSPNLISSLGGS